MAINTLKDITTYSGSDITVVAYKGSKTPAEQFRIDNINQQLRKINKEIEDLDREQSLSQAETIDEISSASKSLMDEYQAGKDNFSSISQIVNKEGAHVRLRSIRGNQKALSESEEEVNDVIQSLLDQQTFLTNSLRQNIPFFKLGSLHTISYSSFREKHAVRNLGRVQAKGYTRGTRTVAGTMIFNVLQEHELIKLAFQLTEDKEPRLHPNALMLDQIDPFNLLLIFANEYGQYSALHLLNIDIASEGQQMSIDEIVTQNTMNFYARDLIPMKSLGYAFTSYNDMVKNIGQIITDTTIIISQEFRQYRIDAYQNPFKEKSEFQSLLSQSRGLF